MSVATFILTLATLGFTPDAPAPDPAPGAELAQGTEPFVCPATQPLEDALAGVEDDQSTRSLRAQLGHALSEAHASEREPDPDNARQRCDGAALTYTKLSPQLEQQQQVELTGPPQKTWPYRKAYNHMVVSGVFFSAGVAMGTVPWALGFIPRCFGRDYGCSSPITSISLSLIGLQFAVGGAIGLGVWVHRLKHRVTPQDELGLRIGRSGARLEVAGDGLLLRF